MIISLPLNVVVKDIPVDSLNPITDCATGTEIQNTHVCWYNWLSLILS